MDTAKKPAEAQERQLRKLFP